MASVRPARIGQRFKVRFHAGNLCALLAANRLLLLSALCVAPPGYTGKSTLLAGLCVLLCSSLSVDLQVSVRQS